jgi:hypothetical protein
MQWIGPLEVFDLKKSFESYSFLPGTAVQIPGLEDAGPVVVDSLLPPMTRARLEALLGHPYWAQALLNNSMAAYRPLRTNFDAVRRGLELGRFPPDCSFEILSCASIPESVFGCVATGVLIRPTRAAPCPRFGPGPLEPLSSREGQTLVPGLGLKLVTMHRDHKAMTFEALEALLAKPGWEPAEAAVRNLKFMREHRHSEFAGCLFELHAAPESSLYAGNAYVIWPVRGPAAGAAAAGAGAAAAGAGAPAAGSNRWEWPFDIPQTRHQVLAPYPRISGGPVSDVAPACDPPSREQALGDRFLEAAATGDLEGLAAVAPRFLATPRPGQLIYYRTLGGGRSCCRIETGDAETHAQAVGQALRLSLYAMHEAAAKFLLRLPVELKPAELSEALEAAAGLGQAGLVEALLEDPRTPGDPKTARAAFENAALSGRIEAARLLAGRAGLAKQEDWRNRSFIEKLEKGVAVPSELLDLARGVVRGAGA